MRITKNTSLSMQEIAEWYLVGEEDTNYNNLILFKESWYHEDENKYMTWNEGITKEIDDISKH